MLRPKERYALEWSHLYRKRGFNPGPSAIDAKKLLYRFAADYGWETMFPDEWFTEEAWEQRPTTNLQVMCGRMPWRLLVIDLDGEEARYTWNQWGKTPRTWTVHRDGGASWHLWFRLTPNYPKRLPKRFLWKGDGNHEGIERLCDQSLIVAPPSYHVKHQDSRYRFMDDRCSPLKMPMPATCPQWVLDLKPIEDEVQFAEFVPMAPKVTTRAVEPDTFLSRDEIVSRLGDKTGLAAEWGVKFTGVVRNGGWAECHSIERPDKEPSACVNIHTGVYKDSGATHKPLSIFDLMIATGNAHDFKDAAARLMERIR